jgi:hypothetical protein
MSSRNKVHGSATETSSSWRGIFGVFIVFIVILIFTRGQFLPNLSVQGLDTKYNGIVTNENVQHVQNLLEESKALLAELKTTNVSISAHTSQDLSHVDHINAAQVAADLQLMKEKYIQANSELEQYKKLSAQSENHGDGNNNVEELAKCHHDLRNARTTHDGSGNEGFLSNIDTSTKHEDNWLIIGIPTVGRSENQDYLVQTLASISHQLPSDSNDLLYKRIKVLVVNIEGESHKRFYEAQAMFADGHATLDPITSSDNEHPQRHTKHQYFEFITLSEEYKTSSRDFHDVKPGATAANDQGNANKPGYKVRKQTRSIAQVLKRAMGRAKYYLFLEDDMLLCPNGFSSIHYMLSKATRYSPDWLALRASYGMNGIFIHDKDVDHFYKYLVNNQIRRPPDHLAVEWFAGESKESKAHKGARANLAYRFNIFDHIGISSTLRKEKQTSFPRCYENLGEPTLFKVEAFNPRACPQDDIWPCVNHGTHKNMESDKALVRWMSYIK